MHSMSWLHQLRLWPQLRIGVAEKNGVLRVFKVYWRPQLICKLVN